MKMLYEHEGRKFCELSSKLALKYLVAMKINLICENILPVFFFIFTVRIMLISGSVYVMLFVQRIEPAKHASSN